MNIQERAKMIATLIAEVDTKYRGNLLVLAGYQLRKEAQGFTGNLIMSAGFEYGVNPKQLGHPNHKECDEAPEGGE